MKSLYWLAGLWDGEGSVSTRMKGRRPIVQLSLNMTDKKTVDEAARIFESYGIKVSRTDRPVPGQKHAYMLFICSKMDIMRACDLLEPHCLTKAAELFAASMMLAHLSFAPAEQHTNIYLFYRNIININRGVTA